MEEKWAEMCEWLSVWATRYWVASDQHSLLSLETEKAKMEVLAGSVLGRAYIQIYGWPSCCLLTWQRGKVKWLSFHAFSQGVHFIRRALLWACIVFPVSLFQIPIAFWARVQKGWILGKTQHLISGLDSMGKWQGWFLEARKCSAEKVGLQIFPGLTG